MVFDGCQCQMIKVPPTSLEEQGQQPTVLTWTKLDQLHIGRCNCPKCEINYHRGYGYKMDKREKIETHNFEHVPFRPASLKSSVEKSYSYRHSFDYCEVKRNLLESAFETAESIVSLGAVVSLT